MSDEVAVDPVATVTATHEGRTLSGVGVDAAQLAETMERRTTVDESGPAAVPASAAGGSAQPEQTRGQKRFSELTQQRKDAEAKADAIQREFDAYKASITQPPAAQSAPQAAAATTSGPVTGETGQPSPPTRPEPTEDEVGTKYETYGAFVKDQAQWVWEQQQSRISDLVRQGIETNTQQQAFLSHVERTRAKGRAAYKDFDAMLQSGPGTHVNMPQGAIQTIYALPNSEHVQYAIMRDGALAQRLAGLAARDPYAFALELVAIAPAAPAVSTASTGAPGSVTPPAPMQPVGSGSKTTSLSSAEHAASGNYAAYKAARIAERGGTRRR